MHVEAVRRLLAATGGSEDELDCGVEEDRPPEPIYNNCSGKHAGMLATCRANGWPVEGYRAPTTRCSGSCSTRSPAAVELEPAEVGTGIDGCGVVAFAIPLERAARAFAPLETLDGGDRGRLGDARAPRARRRRGRDGHAADAGAPGHGRQGRGRGAALRRPARRRPGAQGRRRNGRALRPALAVLTAELGVPMPEFEQVTLPNRHGEAAAIVALDVKKVFRICEFACNIRTRKRVSRGRGFDRLLVFLGRS